MDAPAEGVLHPERDQCSEHAVPQRLLLGFPLQPGKDKPFSILPLRSMYAFLRCIGHHQEPVSMWHKWTTLSVYMLAGAAAFTLCLATPCVWCWPQAGLAIDNLLKHGVNNFFILADVLLSRQPFVSYHYQVGRLGHAPVWALAS